MPELKLGLNDKVLFEMQNRTTRGKLIEMEDIKFQQCVLLSKFESERHIFFYSTRWRIQLDDLQTRHACKTSNLG
jgi:hypothetical protein